MTNTQLKTPDSPVALDGKGNQGSVVDSNKSLGKVSHEVSDLPRRTDSSISVDSLAAQEFLDTLSAASNTAHLFQTFDDSEAKDPKLARVVTGSTVPDHLWRLNKTTHTGRANAYSSQ